MDFIATIMPVRRLAGKVGVYGSLTLKRSCLDARRALPYSHDNVFHSILGLLGVSTSVYKPELDILNGCTNAE